ncbi:protein disulfide isomerase-like 1-6 [Mercurialis annua]|uniref:protein disulfide isomerase-like 1-6 n=1 Tax=Mercurialis annua TaxID=3986 RepID=UPI002160B821|nr:protein disulfide isomerase-like 1-6 [Mercurialis annua]
MHVKNLMLKLTLTSPLIKEDLQIQTALQRTRKTHHSISLKASIFHQILNPQFEITMLYKSRFIFLTLTIFFLLTFSTTTQEQQESKVDHETANNEDDDNELMELIAIDEEGIDEQDQEHQEEQQKEAEVLSKAQRIVLELNTESVNRVIDGNEYVLVLGYAPWCPRSAELMPQFGEAANRLKELGSSLVMAKLDADRYPKAASVLDVKGFPTLLLFVNGTSLVYSGGFSAEDIVIWARKKTGVPVTRLSSISEAEDFLEKYHMFVLGVFEKVEGHEHKEFLKAAVSDNEIQFVEISDLTVAKVLFPDIKSTNFIGLVKSEPERYTAYEGTFDMENILQFLAHNKFPLVTSLTELNSIRVFSSPIKRQVIVFAQADNFKDLLEPLQEVARKFKSEIMFIYIDIEDENQAKPLLTLFGLEDSEETLVAAFDNKMNSKYLLESDPSPSNIEDFCLGLLHGSLSTYYKSQPIPDNKDASIQIIVGKTFDDLVLSSPKNVLLEVYTPWCIACESTSKQIEKLAKHFKGLDSLVFAKIDASANEHPKLQVEEYPTLLFYPAVDKANPIKLSAKSSSKELAATINKHLKSKEEVAKDEL